MVAGFQRPERPLRSSSWRDVVADMVEGTKRATERFPVTSLLLFLLALQANMEVGEWWFVHLVRPYGYPLYCAVVAAFALELWAEAGQRSPLVSSVSAATAGVAAFSLVHWSATFRLYDPAFVVGLAGLALVAPYLWRGTSAAFWLFAVRACFAFLLTILALLLFAGGLSAILASLTYLFGIQIPEEVYGHVWATASLFAAPLFGLGQLPRDFDDEMEGEALAYVERSMQALGDYVAAPLLIVYAVLLHLYAAMIFVTGVWPEGQVGWLVLGFGICLFAALMVIHPFLTIARPPTRLLLRVWPLALPVPLSLLFLAAMERIGAYGVTPERYLLVLFGVVSAMLTIAQVFPRLRGDIRLIAALPVLALLATSFGPQGATEVSVRSQVDRFQALAVAGDVTPEANAEAISVLHYLAGAQALERVRPADLTTDGEPDQSDLLRRIATAYGFDPDLTEGSDQEFARSFQEEDAVALGSFDILLPSIVLYGSDEESSDGRATRVLPDGRTMEISLAGSAIRITSGGNEALFTLPVERYAQAAGPEEASRTLEVEADGRSVLLIPTHIRGSRQGGDRLESFQGSIALRGSDW